MSIRRLYPGFVTALWLLPLTTLIQSGLVMHSSIRGIYPSIVLILVVNWGILRGTDEGMLWALIGGLCLDTFSPWPLGTSTVALVLVASLVSLGQSTFIKTHALLPPATMFAATLIYYATVLFVLESTQHSVDWVTALQVVAVPVALLNAVLNIPGFWLTQRLEHRVYPMPRANW